MRTFPCGFSTNASHPFALFMICMIAAPAAAEPTFISFDPRLPNPDQPYVMTSGTIVYDSPAIAAFKFWATDPSQLDVPSRAPQVPIPSPGPGGYEFDSTFDVAFEAQMSFGLEPFHPVSGIGTAHARGFARGGSEPVYVFDTELLSLDLVGTSPVRGNFLLRESPTQQSTGITRVEGAPCYDEVCPAVIVPIRVSSFFDVFTEISTNGGVSWTPARDNEAMHVVQLPEPSTLGLLAILVAGIWSSARSRKTTYAAQ